MEVIQKVIYPYTASTNLDQLEKTTNKNSNKYLNSEMLSCNVCTYNTPNPRDLRNHLNIHGSTRKDVQSNGRSISNYYSSGLGYSNVVPQNIEVSFIKTEAENNKSIDIEINECMSCDICKYETFDVNDFRNHVNSHSGSSKDATDLSIQGGDSKIKDNIRFETDAIIENFVCVVCKETFTSRALLCQHKVIHSARKPFPCDECEKSFSAKNALMKHKKIHNPFADPKPLSCDICNSRFAYKSHLETHKLSHTNLRPFQCEICKKSFNQKRHLILHNSIHTGEKPFTCDVCDKSFSRKSNLETHKLIHTNIRPYVCKICYKAFNQKNHLKAHCSTHAQERPFQCNICSKTFTGKLNLVYHKRIHSTERTFFCDYCQKCYNVKTYLVKHIRNHHM